MRAKFLHFPPLQAIISLESNRQLWIRRYGEEGKIKDDADGPWNRRFKQICSRQEKYGDTCM